MLKKKRPLENRFQLISPTINRWRYGFVLQLHFSSFRSYLSLRTIDFFEGTRKIRNNPRNTTSNPLSFDRQRWSLFPRENKINHDAKTLQISHRSPPGNIASLQLGEHVSYLEQRKRKRVGSFKRKYLEYQPSLSTGGRKVGGSSPEFNRFVLNYPPLLFFFFSPSSARNCPPAGNFPLNRRENSLRRLRKGLKPFQIASLQFLLSFRR